MEKDWMEKMDPLYIYVHWDLLSGFLLDDLPVDDDDDDGNDILFSDDLLLFDDDESISPP